jgi:hypothetical protein
MSRAVAVPNSKRAVPVPPIYYALIGEIERMRRRYGIPMWKLDEAAGSNDGYYSKALHADTPTGRMAHWTTFQRYVEVLLPDGFAANLKPSKGRCLSADKHRLAIRFSGARYVLEERQDWLAERQRNGGKKGGPARARKLSKRRRTAIARKAAKKRWKTPKITEILGEGNGSRATSERSIRKGAHAGDKASGD